MNPKQGVRKGIRRIPSGEWGLGKTFWICWVLGNVCIPLIFAYATALIGGVLLISALSDPGNFDQDGSGIFAVLSWIYRPLYLIYFVASSVWTWRAANKQGGSTALAAKVVIVLWAGYVAWYLVPSEFSDIISQATFVKG